MHLPVLKVDDYKCHVQTWKRARRDTVNKSSYDIFRARNLVNDMFLTNEVPMVRNMKRVDQKHDNSRLTKAIVTLVVTSAIFSVLVRYSVLWHHQPTIRSDNGRDIPADELRRIDCYPEAAYGMDTLTEDRCLERGCVYAESAHPRVPWCFVPQTDFGFAVVEGPIPTRIGERYLLRRKTVWAVYQENFENVTFDIEMREDNVLRFKFETPDDPERYQIPWFPFVSDQKADNPAYVVTVYQRDPFSFRIHRASTGTIIWDTGVGGLVFADQFLQIATALPTTNIYGFGENLHRSLKHDTNFRSWPIFARDQPPSSGSDKELPLYSMHPFYECLESDGSAHGVLLWNSNSMDYTLTPYPMLVYKTIGGIFDFFLFMGPSPENVIEQYTGAVGRSIIPPYYSLGFQLSRYGYTNTSDMRAAMERTLSYGIPVDLQYADIDHMDRQRTFTLDYENFTDLPQYVDELHEAGMRTVIILNPNLEIADDYEPFVLGRNMSVFVEFENADVMPPGDYEMYNSTNVMGTVWPEWIVNFVDFFKTDSKTFWHHELELEYDIIPYDGIWLDMNEPANFDTNREKAWNWPEDRWPYYTLKCPLNKWDDPPYRSKAVYVHDDVGANLTERLSFKTICMQSTHGDRMDYKHYDVHNLYGHYQCVVTYQALTELFNKRPLIITRSTAPGDGRFGGRWLGDNDASWVDLKLSIIGMLEFNLFGIPYIGADICGFFNNCTSELCKRWHQLGAFYPYARNHNHIDPLPQDPGWFGDSVAIPTRVIMTERYRLLPYLYTLFYHAHTAGSTVVRPLFHEFPSDSHTHDIDEQFLWGPALLISPILKQDAVWLAYYLPPGRWYNYWDGSLMADGDGFYMNVTINANSTTQLHVRGGYVIPTQVPDATTTASRLNPFGLLVALDQTDGQARGELFWDDGQSLNTTEKGQYYLSQFNCSFNALRMTVDHNNDTSIASLRLDTVSVYGVSAATVVYVNKIVHNNFTFNQDKQILKVNSLGLPVVTDFIIEWEQ